MLSLFPSNAIDVKMRPPGLSATSPTVCVGVDLAVADEVDDGVGLAEVCAAGAEVHPATAATLTSATMAVA
jgi:hypothetical protein